MTDNREVRRLARTLAALERRLDTMQAPQLHRSSLEDGAIEEFDSEGNLVGIIGRQEDGSHAYVPYTGPVPPIPDTPVVYIKPGFFRAGWNGKFVDPTTYVVDPLLVPPHDFARVEVHVGETADFTPDVLPDSATRVGTIEAPGGGMLTQIVEPGTYYVRLVTRTTPGKYSEPSVAVEVVVEPALDQSELVADLEQLRSDLEAARDWIDESGADLASRLATAEDNLETASDSLAAAKSRLDTAFGIDQTVNVPDLVEQAKTEALSGAASDAQAKADAARQAAEQAAQQYADGAIDAKALETLQQAASDAQAKADAAKAAALSEAAITAQAKADAAQAAAEAAAQQYADGQIDAAQVAILNAAASDAQNKATAAQTAAQQYADSVASAAKAEALDEAAADAQQKADAAKAAAEQAAKDYADGAISASELATLQAAAADAQEKADDAADAAKAYADGLAQALAADIATAQDTADTAMTTASGKNRVFYSTVAPNAVGTNIGDIWRRRDANGTILGEWRWDGGTTVAGWKPVDYGDGILRSLDVGKITAGTGEVDELVAQVFATAMADIIEANIGNLYVTEGAEIDEAVIERLWADVVRSRKITTDMLLVGAGENLLVDPTFTDPDLTAHRFDQSIGEWTTGTSSEDSQRYVTTPAGNSAVLNLAPSPDADYSPVVPGNAYRIRGRFQGSERSARPRVNYRRGDGTTAVDVLSWSALGSWADHEWEWVAPSDAAEARFDIEFTPSTVRTYVKRLSVTSKTDASLIVDGTIKGRHVDAESVAAEVGEFVKVKASNIEAGDIDVALRLTAGGEVQVGYEDEEHVLIDPAVGVEYRIPGPETDTESEPITVSRMGRSYAVIDPASGDTLAALTEEGDVTGIGAEFQSLSVGGLDVFEEINARPLGPVASSGFEATQRGPYTTETGVWELPFLAREGRRYRIEVIGQAQSSVDAVIGRFHYRTGLTADSVPAPTVNDPQFRLQYWRGSGNWNNVYGAFTYEPTQTRFLRVLFSIEPLSGQSVSFRNMIFSVYDEGTQPEARGRHSLGGASGTTPDPTPPPQTFDQEFWFDWSASYNQFGRTSAENYVGSTKMRQGKDAYTNNPYAAALRIPDSARSLMMGASKVEVWVRLTHAGPYSSGTPRFGRHTSSASSPPSTMPSVYSGWTASSSLAKGGTKWYKMPSDWAAGFISGTYYGITLGTTSGAFNFMDFYKHNYSDTSKRPRLRVRVTK